MQIRVRPINLLYIYIASIVFTILSMKTITDLLNNGMEILRASPALFIVLGFLVAVLSPSKWSIGYLISVLFSCILNGILKETILRPIYKIIGKDSLPILGIGRRPKGAMNCGDFIHCPPKISTSFGMPSGHSQITWFSVVYIALLLTNKYNEKTHITKMDNIKYTLALVILLMIGLSVSYSRVLIGCHTFQQVIVGGLIGSGLALVAFYIIKRINV